MINLYYRSYNSYTTTEECISIEKAYKRIRKIVKFYKSKGNKVYFINDKNISISNSAIEIGYIAFKLIDENGVIKINEKDLTEYNQIFIE